MTEGTLKVDLRNTKTETEKSDSWIKRIFGIQKEIEQEVVDQAQALEKLYKVFTDIGYNNVSSLEINGREVYSDPEFTAEDFEKALKLALEEESKKVYHIEIVLNTPQEDDGDYVNINMYSRHEPGEYPLNIFASIEKKDCDELKEFLESVRTKIEEQFEVESVAIDIDEDSDTTGEEEVDSEEGEDEDDEDSEDDEDII